MLLGLLVANMDALHWGRLHSRDLQPYQNHITTRTDILLQVPLRVWNSLRWWTSSSNLNRGKVISGSRGTRNNPIRLGSCVAKQPSSRSVVSGRNQPTDQPAGTSSHKTGPTTLRGRPEGSSRPGPDRQRGGQSTCQQTGDRGHWHYKEALCLLQWVEGHLLSIRAEHVKGSGQLTGGLAKPSDDSPWIMNTVKGAVPGDHRSVRNPRSGSLRLLSKPSSAEFFTRYHHTRKPKVWMH